MNSESDLDVSFDPRSWVGPEMGGTGTPASPAAAGDRPAPKPRRAIAAVASIAIIILGAALAWSQRAAGQERARPSLSVIPAQAGMTGRATPIKSPP